MKTFIIIQLIVACGFANPLFWIQNPTEATVTTALPETTELITTSATTTSGRIRMFPPNSPPSAPMNILEKDAEAAQHLFNSLTLQQQQILAQYTFFIPFYTAQDRCEYVELSQLYNAQAPSILTVDPCVPTVRGL